MFDYVEQTTVLPEVDTITIKNKRWYETPNGTYPSVTTILGHEEKPWLNDWKNMLGEKKANKETKRCSKRGEAVHLMSELYLKNVPIEEVTKGQERSNIQLFNMIKLAFNKRINNIRAQEVGLWSDQLMLAGRVDCIAEYDGVLSVIDFKTSNNDKDEKMIQDYLLQCTAYALMYTELYGEPIDDIVVIIAVENGLMPLVYKKKIDDYIEPLMVRLNDFFESL